MIGSTSFLVVFSRLVAVFELYWLQEATITCMIGGYSLMGTRNKESYFSKTTGVDRFYNIYLPPHYSKNKSYNVLYVLHGIGGTEDEWIDNCDIKTIMDSYYNNNSIEQMIVIFPNGRAMNPDSVPRDVYGAVAQTAFGNFEKDLIADLLPHIESRYPVMANPGNRGICGLSMGGGQALNIGLAHPELFSYVGAFSPAPNTDTTKFRLTLYTNPPLIWLLCGKSDDLLFVSEKVDAFLSLHSIQHTYRTMQGGHDWSVWQTGFQSFVQWAFRSTNSR